MSALGAAVFSLRNCPADLAELMERVHAFGAQAGLTERVLGRAALIVEELVANAINHGFARPGTGRIRVAIRLRTDRVAIAIRDDGRPFDPFVQALPDPEVDLDARSVGGLGLALVRATARRCRHRRAHGCNLVHLTVDRDA